MNKIHEILKDKKIREMARRMTSAGYPITHPALIHWRQGENSPRLDRLVLAEKVIRPNDPEIADIINEIISALE